jgi:hypothetical protein
MPEVAPGIASDETEKCALVLGEPLLRVMDTEQGHAP